MTTETVRYDSEEAIANWCPYVNRAAKFIKSRKCWKIQPKVATTEITIHGCKLIDGSDSFEGAVWVHFGNDCAICYASPDHLESLLRAIANGE